MKTYRDLIAWQMSMVLVTMVYDVSRNFPKDEVYGLTNQMRRATVSIPSNIAEGFERNSKAELIRFSQIAMGSIFELQTQVEIGRNLMFIDDEVFQRLYEQTREVERILSAFIKSQKD
ncbi:four helix bundle protein [Breznakibacter xylanolyticus]|uniref:Four helix bundle protein n=1 Tax=Breznakibacter xylanolyticus TaxID=990 RepID=A0A2W7NVS7_9BACT|nr:four helix bundle protein [Breznakibacter xylanolyticus]PZX17406.1 four helix bundle protein [Breznakibacter xylanolyticus]